MKKLQTKKRMVSMLVVFVLLLLAMYWVNIQNNQSKNVPEEFIIQDTTETTNSSDRTSTSDETVTTTYDSSSSSDSEEIYESTYNGEQDIAARFANTYLQFSTDSIDKVKDIVDPSLITKLEQVKGEEQEINSISLLDKSIVDEKNIYVYEFKATLKDDKSTKKSGKIFIIMKETKNEDKANVVSDLEWTYET